MAAITEERINAVFDYFDLSQDDQLSRSELKTALQILKVDLTDQEIREYDTDGNESYSREEFKQLYTEKFQNIDCKGNLRECMKEMDEHDSGNITRDQLKDILTKGDEPMTEEEAEELLNDFDNHKDGIFDINELISIMYPEDTEPTEEPKVEEEY